MPSQAWDTPSPSEADDAAEGRPWWKVCCVGCCLGIIALVVALVVGVRLFAGSGPRPVDRIPTTFPAQLPLYRVETADEILYYPAAAKNAMSRIATAPLSWVSHFFGSSGDVDSVQNAIGAQLRRIEGRDTVVIRWRKLQTSRDDLIRFYAGALQQAGMPPGQMRRDDGGLADELASRSATISFTLLITDEPLESGLDNVTLVVEYVVPDTP